MQPNAETITRISEAALSPIRAWEFHSPMRKTWPMPPTNPDLLCAFYAKNPYVKPLIWC